MFRRTLLIGLVAVPLLTLIGIAHADTPPTPEVSTPTLLPTAVLTTPSPEATAQITVTQEQSTPVATSAPYVGQSPTPAPTSILRGENSGSATPTPLPGPAAAASPSIAWPTPAQLRLDAELRWGKRVPASVHRWAFLIVPAAKRYGVDPDLVAAVMTMESGGDPLALSPSNAHGLMQVLDGPWDPATNVDIGVHMLSDLYSEFGSWPLALAGYNAGPGAVEEYNGVPPYRETRDYVIIVTYLWHLYSHRPLTSAETLLYQSTLRDLVHFKDQRHKVSRLAGAAHVGIAATPNCVHTACPDSQSVLITSNLDPFWLDASVPDPLAKVAPPPALLTRH